MREVTITVTVEAGQVKLAVDAVAVRFRFGLSELGGSVLRVADVFILLSVLRVADAFMVLSVLRAADVFILLSELRVADVFRVLSALRVPVVFRVLDGLRVVVVLRVLSPPVLDVGLRAVLGYVDVWFGNMATAVLSVLGAVPESSGLEVVVFVAGTVRDNKQEQALEISLEI